MTTDTRDPVLAKLSLLDRFLPVWILAAMAGGLILGRVVPGVQGALDSVKVDQTSLPIALGLLLMMYPVLAKVRYEDMGHVTGDRKLLWLSLLLNWLIGPALMFTLAWVFLVDQPALRTGLIVIGLARCIAMVLIFLGIPLVAGYFTRRIGLRTKGKVWYEGTFIPRIAPFALCGLLFTIVVMFALQGDAIISDPISVVQIAIPLLAYFAIMWGVSFALGAKSGLGYPKTATLAFTAAGNNFELAIAVSIGVWGVTSGQALTGVIGPLIEVPALVALVYVSLWLRRRFFS